MTMERCFPQSLDAERALLGSILLDNGAFNAIAGTISPSDMFADSHRLIMEKIVNLSAKHQVFDVVTLAEELSNAGALEKVGGAAYLSSLSDGVPMGDYSFVQNYARIVREKSLKRRLIHAAHNAMSSAFDGPETAEECIERAISELMDISAGDKANLDQGMDLRTAAKNLLRTLSEGQPSRVLTGVKELDEVTGGFLGGELILVTAETGVGKSLFSWQTRAEACVCGKHSLYASGEMSAEQLVGRELCSIAGVRHWKMRQPEDLTDYDWEALSDAAPRQCEQCTVIHGDLSLSRIRSAARRAEYGLVVVDYDEVVRAPGLTELDQQRNLAIGLKLLAMELGIPVILVSQLRKALQGENRAKPTLHRLYGSGAKAKNASLVIYIDRKFVQQLEGDETEAQICVLKSRDGKVGVLRATFNVKTLRFESVSSDQRGD